MPTIGTHGNHPNEVSQIVVWCVDLAASAVAIRTTVERLGAPFAAEPGTTRNPAGTPVLEAKALARLALRLTLARLVGTSRAFAPFHIRPGGKPVLAPGDLPGPAFSLSHSDVAALIAIAGFEPVGADLETTRPLRLPDHRRILLEQAAQSLAPETPLPAGPPEDRFVQAWVRLEAFAKATGDGMGHVLGLIREDANARLESTPSAGPRLRVCDLPSLTVGGIVHLAALAAPASNLPMDRPAPAVKAFPTDPDLLWEWLHTTS